MNATRPALFAVVILGLCTLIAGCGDESTTPTSNETPLLPPQNVVVSHNAAGEVFLAWDRNSQSTLRGYNVYRRNSVESSIQKLTPRPIAENHYKDVGVESGREYEYRVTSVSNRGSESVFASTMIKVQPPTRGVKDKPQV
ncbi:MAG: fibronectin type III domain-containing protein [Candidatus Krumholzibacteria bacterium]|nr:fibronectin type III domain-containing protein [Candidatus Krumholzibacteria bacterium]